jgi:hypothetical protein
MTSRPGQLPRLDAGTARGRDRALRATYDLRHTFATVAQRAGIGSQSRSFFARVRETNLVHGSSRLASRPRLDDSLEGVPGPACARGIGYRDWLGNTRQLRSWRPNAIQALIGSSALALPSGRVAGDAAMEFGIPP